MNIYECYEIWYYNFWQARKPIFFIKQKSVKYNTTNDINKWITWECLIKLKR